MIRVAPLFVVLAACGGSPFAMAPAELGSYSPDDARAPADDAADDLLAPDASPDAPVAHVDAGSVDAALSIDAQQATDAAGDSCATEPPELASCGTAPETTYPAHYCVQNSAGYSAVTTPAACASWCAFTCACLIANGVCPDPAHVDCETDYYGDPIRVTCGE